MDKKALKSYVTDIRDSEIVIYKQSEIINRLQTRVDQLGHKKDIKWDDVETKYCDNDGSERHVGILTFLGAFVGFGIVASIALFLFGIVFYFVVLFIGVFMEVLAVFGMNTLETGFYAFSARIADMSYYLPIAFKISLIVGIIIAILMGILWNWSNAETNKENAKIKKIREKEMSSLIYNENQRVNKELEIKNKLMKQIYFIKEQQDINKAALKALYDKRSVPNKLRGLAQALMIYEYIDMRICLELEGPFGAYNKWHEDLKYMNLVDKIDNIASKIDDIRNTQKNLYDVVIQVNETVNKVDSTNNTMIQSLGKIDQNTYLTQLNTADSALSNRIMCNLSIYDHLR